MQPLFTSHLLYDRNFTSKSDTENENKQKERNESKTRAELVVIYISLGQSKKDLSKRLFKMDLKAITCQKSTTKNILRKALKVTPDDGIIWLSF